MLCECQTHGGALGCHSEQEALDVPPRRPTPFFPGFFRASVASPESEPPRRLTATVQCQPPEFGRSDLSAISREKRRISGACLLWVEANGSDTPREGLLGRQRERRPAVAVQVRQTTRRGPWARPGLVAQVEERRPPELGSPKRAPDRTVRGVRWRCDWVGSEHPAKDGSRRLGQERAGGVWAEGPPGVLAAPRVDPRSGAQGFEAYSSGVQLHAFAARRSGRRLIPSCHFVLQLASFDFVVGKTPLSSQITPVYAVLGYAAVRWRFGRFKKGSERSETERRSTVCAHKPEKRGESLLLSSALGVTGAQQPLAVRGSEWRVAHSAGKRRDKI